MKLTSKGRYAVMALVDLAKFDNINPVFFKRYIIKTRYIFRLFRTIFSKVKKKTKLLKVLEVIEVDTF